MTTTRIVAWVAVLIVTAALADSAFGAAGASRLYAGTAKVDITPTEKDAVDLSARKLTIQDHIYARVLVLKSGNTSVAIVSLDLILFSSHKVILYAKKKLRMDHVILSSSHTHSSMAPEGLIIGRGGPDWTRRVPDECVNWSSLSKDPWYAKTERQIVTAIKEAKKNLFPAQIVWGRGSFKSEYMAHNRRRVNADGSITMIWDNPGKVPTEPVDPTVGFIRIDDHSGKPRAFLVHYACHPVGLMGAGILSRDYPGAMVDYVEKELGDQCMAMFIQGAEGDLDPYHVAVRGARGIEITRQAGISLGHGALQVAKDSTNKSRKKVSIKARDTLVKIKRRSGPKTTDVLLTTIVIDKDLALVNIPGEPFIQHQLDLREKSPVANTFMMGVAYSGAGCPFLVYVPTAQAVKEGGYGATEASFVAADAGEQMVNAAVTVIKKLVAK